MENIEISEVPVRPGTLTWEQTSKIINAMIEYTTVTKPGRGMAFAVVDEAGVLMGFARMPGTTLNNRRTAENKAWTAIVFKRNTREMRDLLAKTGHTLSDYCEPDKLTVIPGGNLIRSKEGYVVGAIGVTGRPEDVDEEVAMVGVAAYDPTI